MNTYFVKGAYETTAGYTYKFDIVFDLRPVNAENFKRQIRLKLDISEDAILWIENVVKL